MMAVHGLVLTEMAAELKLPIEVIYALELMVGTELSAACVSMVLGTRTFRFDDAQDHYWKSFRVDWDQLASAGNALDEDACERFLDDQEWSEEVGPNRRPQIWRPSSVCVRGSASGPVPR